MDKASKENYEKNIKKMNNKEEEISNYNKNKQLEECEVGEDSTKYGEFISSYFAWVSLPQQKENVEKLEKITKNEENLKNNKKK